MKVRKMKAMALGTELNVLRKELFLKMILVELPRD